MKIDTGIIRRGNTYRFTVALGIDVNGKQIRKTTTWKPPEDVTQKKADKLAKEAYLAFKNRCKGLSELNENMRFIELCEQYFKVYAPNKLKPITAYNYQKIVDSRFTEYFGNKKLKDITTGMLTDFFCKQTTTTKDGIEKPVKPSTAKCMFTAMQSIMHFAVSQHYIKESPCSGVILPQKDSTQEETRKFLTEDELPRFLALFDGYSDFNTMILFLLHTGVRSGEMLVLRWQDVDFEDQKIYIQHTLSSVGGKQILTTPKTKGSKRIIYMSQTVYDLLKEHRRHQLEKQMILTNFPHPEMVFTSQFGYYKDRSSLNTSFRRFLKGTEFDFLTLHCLRHTNATLLLNSGVDIKIVSEHLGHSDISTTGNIYADVLASSKRKTSELIELKLAK